MRWKKHWMPILQNFPPNKQIQNQQIGTYRLMDYSKLEDNIRDMVKEEQIKLGYTRETIRLYYPLSTLNRFLHTELDAAGMEAYLTGFCLSVVDRFGHVEISRKKDRFCFMLPPETAEYVHTQIPDSPFLTEFIRIIGTHGATLDQVLAPFYRYSDEVQVEKIIDGEFDYLVYFRNGKPDTYRYLLTEEMGHITYHRFTEEDLKDFL